MIRVCWGLSACDMQESGDLSGEAAVHIVDEGIKEAGGTMQGEDVVIGDGGRDEGTMTFVKGDLVTCAANTQTTGAFKTHGDDEAVVLHQVTVEGCCNLHDTNTEIGGVDNLDGRVSDLPIVGAIVTLNMIIEGLCRQIGMQLARLSIHT